MRKIVKTAPPPSFEFFKAHYKRQRGHEPRFDRLRGETKYDLKIQLIHEQYGLCCYCMKRISKYNSHIEHFVPRSYDPSLEMDYFNLFASCNGYNEQRENCGHQKLDWYDPSVMVSPTDDLCEQLFEYTPDGRILSKDKRGQAMIKHLDLDNMLLNRARKAAIELSGLFDEDLTDEDILDLIEDYNTPEKGRLEPFCKAVTYCLEKFIDFSY